MRGNVEYRRFRCKDSVKHGGLSFTIPSYPVVVGDGNRVFGTCICIGRKEGSTATYRGPLDVHFGSPAIIDIIRSRSKALKLPTNCLCLNGVMSLEWEADKPYIKMHTLTADSHPQPVIFVKDVISYTPNYKSFIVTSGGTSCFGIELKKDEPFVLGKDIQGNDLEFDNLEHFIRTLPEKTIYFDRGSHIQPLLPHRVFVSKPALLEYFIGQLRAPFSETSI